MKSPPILITGFTYYPNDPRIRRQAEALVQEGFRVTVLCLRQPAEAPRGEVNGVRIVRLPLAKERRSVWRYLFGYSAFFLLAAVAISLLHLRHRFAVLQFFNLPDFLVFAGLLPKLTGAKLVFDYRDAMPDQYVSKYGLGWNHPLILLLRLVERASIAFCNHVVTVHEPYRRLARERGARPDEISIFMNFPDPNLFNRSRYPERPRNGRFLLLYHGTIAPRFDLDTVVQAAMLLRPHIPGLQVQILGTGDAMDSLRALVRELDLEGVVSVSGPVPLSEVPARISQADVGLAPARPDKLEDLVLSTKLLEYLAMGKPVIASRRTIIVDYVGEEAVRYYRGGDPADLAAQIECLYREEGERERLVAAGEAFMRRHPWTEIKRDYLTVMSRLSGRAPE